MWKLLTFIVGKYYIIQKIYFCLILLPLSTSVACHCLVGGKVQAVCDTLARIDETCSMEVQFFGNRRRKAGSTLETYQENCK